MIDRADYSTVRERPMIITKDHIGGLVFLSLSVVYGYYAGDIALLPGDG